MTSLTVRLACFIAWVSFLPITVPANDLTILRESAGLSEDEWEALDRGEVQAKVLDTQNKREVAIVGIAHLQASADCFVARFRDIETFKDSPDILRIHKFDSRLLPSGLAQFGLETRDVNALKDCAAGDCEVKLPIRAMERLDHTVDWHRVDYAPTVQSIVREEIQAYLRAYVDRGNAALIEYHDKKKPVRLQEEFRELLNGRPRVKDFAPDFQEYLAQYPNDKLPGVSEFFYWSLESFGLGPVTSVTHVSVYEQPGRAVVASKQIFASHYFDSSLGLTVAIDDPIDSSIPGMYLLYVNRSRVDLLGGFFGGLKRALAGSRMREGMRSRLAAAVEKLESGCLVVPRVPPQGQKAGR